MTSTEYVQPKDGWVRDQLAAIDDAGTTAAANVQGRPIVVFTVKGAKSGKLRRVPLMRVEHDGAYAAVASYGGAPKHPTWYASMRANPTVDVQDGTEHQRLVMREVTGPEREAWWERCVEAFPDYADYQIKTDRVIPVLVGEPA